MPGNYCEHCRKTSFYDEITAQIMLARIDHGVKRRRRAQSRRHSEQETRSYRCPRGHGFHLTHWETSDGTHDQK